MIQGPRPHRARPVEKGERYPASPAQPSQVAWEAVPYEKPRVGPPDPSAVMRVVLALVHQHGTADLGNRADPVEELVWIPLTRQTHRQNSMRSWERVQAIGGPEALLVTPEAELTELLKDAGFSRQKARWIKRSLEVVQERFGGLSLEETSAWPDQELERFLASLPGIKLKSAKCVMMYSLGRQVLPVDTHLRRLAERLGWVPEGLSEKRIHQELEAAVAAELRLPLHVNAIWHGRAVCRAVRPRCGECVVRWACVYGVKEA